METPKHEPQRLMETDEPHAVGLTPTSFAASYRTYAVPLYRYFYQHTGNAADAEDLTAVTIGKALANLRTYSGRAPLAAWLFGIARHTLHDFQRRQGNTVTLDDVALSLADATPLPEQSAVTREQRDDLHAHIRVLPTNQREALTLRYFGALTIAEIAVLLDRSDGAVKLLIHRAMTTLRTQYRQEEQQ